MVQLNPEGGNHVIIIILLKLTLSNQSKLASTHTAAILCATNININVEKLILILGKLWCKSMHLLMITYLYHYQRTMLFIFIINKYE